MDRLFFNHLSIHELRLRRNLAPGLLFKQTPAEGDGHIAEAGNPDQERTMADQIKDMPEKKLDKITAENVKGGKTKKL